MGEDKALMPFLGVPLIQRLVDRFQVLDARILIITNRPDYYSFLDAPLYEDILPGRGALGGLYTALMISDTRYVGLIAADMPFASPQLLASLLGLIQDSAGDALLPSSPQGPEPLHAVYQRETCLPLVEKAIAEDLWRMNSWHSWGRVQILDPAETAAAAGDQRTFINLNTPDEFEAAEDLARDQGLL